MTKIDGSRRGDGKITIHELGIMK